MKPLLFLDVDGVLNVLNFEAEHDFIEVDGMSAWVPKGIKERLEPLWEAFDVIWATAWMGRAHGCFREHLGLPETAWDHVKWLNLKLPEIIKVAQGRPWAWVDDDAQWECNQLHEAFAELPNTLIVQPDSLIGITDEHVTQLLEFAKQQTTNGEPIGAAR